MFYKRIVRSALILQQVQDERDKKNLLEYVSI
jgi:hypothetical protein